MDPKLVIIKLPKFVPFVYDTIFSHAHSIVDYFFCFKNSYKRLYKSKKGAIRLLPFSIYNFYCIQKK
jgi:hypothetical protein